MYHKDERGEGVGNGLLTRPQIAESMQLGLATRPIYEQWSVLVHKIAKRRSASMPKIFLSILHFPFVHY